MATVEKTRKGVGDDAEERALQARADPWLGWTELNGVGQVVSELSPYEADLEWGSLTEPDEILPLLANQAFIVRWDNGSTVPL